MIISIFPLVFLAYYDEESFLMFLYFVTGNLVCSVFFTLGNNHLTRIFKL